MSLLLFIVVIVVAAVSPSVCSDQSNLYDVPRMPAKQAPSTLSRDDCASRASSHDYDIPPLSDTPDLLDANPQHLKLLFQHYEFDSRFTSLRPYDRPRLIFPPKLNIYNTLRDSTGELSEGKTVSLVRDPDDVITATSETFSC